MLLFRGFPLPVLEEHGRNQTSLLFSEISHNYERLDRLEDFLYKDLVKFIESTGPSISYDIENIEDLMSKILSGE